MSLNFQFSIPTDQENADFELAPGNSLIFVWANGGDGRGPLGAFQKPQRIQLPIVFRRAFRMRDGVEHFRQNRYGQVLPMRFLWFIAMAERGCTGYQICCWMILPSED